MRDYLNLLKHVLENGEKRMDRTGVGTRSIFSADLSFRLEDRFPLLTTKRVHFRSIVHELLWFISGDTNIKYLNDHGVKIWNEWADENGDLGPVYGAQWRNYNNEGIDQLGNIIELIKNDPTSRRMVISSWNPSQIPNMALPPCHCLYQFYVREGRWLDCKMYQRSADIFLGVPFNIASYALLTNMIAHVTELHPGKLHITFGDLHLYENHVEQATLQLTRKPCRLPRLVLDTHTIGAKKINSIDDFTYEDIHLLEYTPDTAIKAPIAV